MIRYKIDVIQALKDAGYTSYQSKKNMYINPLIWDRIKKGEGVNFDTLNRLCNLLEMKPGDILEWVPDEDELQMARGFKKKPKKTQEPGG